MDGFGASEQPRSGARVHARPGSRPLGVVIRAAREDELDRVAALFEPALEVYRGTPDDWALDNYLADLVNVRERVGLAETYIASDHGEIVGSVAFYRDVALEGWSTLPGGWTGFRALVVHPAARGRGVGRSLVEQCLERSRELGAPTLGIHTIALLAEAVRLYERLGFVRCPEFDLRVKDVFGAPPEKDLHGLAFRYDL